MPLRVQLFHNLSLRQDAFLEIPALLVLPLSHEIADHLIILKRYSHPEILLSFPCGGEAAVLADWSSCRLKECAGRSAEMYGSGGEIREVMVLS